jgi:oligoendopeptidase F
MWKGKDMSEPASDQLGEMPLWDLSDLYPAMNSPELEADLEKAAKITADFENKYKGRLIAILENEGGDALANIIAEYEECAELLGRIGSYAGLLFASDNEDAQIAKFYGDTQQDLTTISTSLLFFELELNHIGDDVLTEALDESEALGRYRPWLMDLRRDKPFQLSSEVERLFHEKSITSSGAWNRLFNETISSLRFKVGKKKLTLEAAQNLMSEKDADKRREAAKAIAATLGENIRLFTLIANTLAKDKEISDSWRGYEDIADSRHVSNRVEREVVDALEAAVRKSYESTSHRYYALKAKWFGRDKLDYWDRNAPLPMASKRIFPWKRARRVVLEAYAGFDPQMAKLAEPFFDNGWIDAPMREGKTPGAFAHPTVPSVHPYILLNYQGKPRDVMTLAHELGHGVHQRLAAGKGPLMSSTPLTLAETASVFGEMLTFRSLLDNAANALERKVLLAGKVEDMINTVMRQIAFYAFERKLHGERRQGELTSERIGELWMSVQGESLGPAIVLNDGYEVYWSYIPHFIHTPFYVYAYAFGDCLVNSLYAVYQEEPEGFAEKYFDMLRAGGSKHHKELLAPFGLDASEPDFWSRGLSVISDMIDELEGME